MSGAMQGLGARLESRRVIMVADLAGFSRAVPTVAGFKAADSASAEQGIHLPRPGEPFDPQTPIEVVRLHHDLR
jgi:hypothetical protein